VGDEPPLTPSLTMRARPRKWSRCNRSLLSAYQLVLWSGLTSLILCTSSAEAQTSSEAMAESLFVEARRLMAEGKLAAACPKLRESNALDPQLGTLLNLGKCYEQNGQTASAWATFTELSRLAARAGQKARADYAAERVQILEPELAYVTVRLSGSVSQVTVHIDDERLSMAVLGTALPLDPGSHRLSVEAPDHRPYSQTLLVEPGSRQDVEVPPLEPIVVEPAPVTPSPEPVISLPPPSPPPLPPAPPPAESTSSSSWWPAAVVGYGVAGTGVVVGAVTGILALDAGGSLNCSMGACPPSDADTLSRATTLANVANASFAIAGVGAIVGIVATVLAVNDDDGDGDVSFRDGVLRF